MTGFLFGMTGFLFGMTAFLFGMTGSLFGMTAFLFGMTAFPFGVSGLSVRDDGAGVEPEHLKALQEQLDVPSDDRENLGFGLFYIAERVRMYYGEGSRTVIESEEGVYTEVSILIPLDKAQREPSAVEEKQDV